jgi:GR25 family glycosyltransferase involved in LPS biosynthesis
MPHPTFVINLKKRTDRKAHIMREFNCRQEFSFNIVEAVEDPKGAIGLWYTIQRILSNINREYIIICEDDTEFTKHYSKKYLNDSIARARKFNADILLGGISWSSSFIQISSKLFWVEKFAGAQFMVIFQKFMEVIRNASMDNFDAADYRIASLTHSALFMFPFISTQKEFGYSDATPNNNQPGRVSAFFKSTAQKIKLLKQVDKTYRVMQKKIDKEKAFNNYENIIISTYIINLSERKEGLKYIRKEFAGKPEFDVKIVKACKHKIGACSLWLSIRKVIRMAIQNNDDVIVICEDNHQFTSHYSKEYFLKNVIEAYKQGASYLSGGTERFNYAVPITENRFWISNCLSTQFIVIYKRFFNCIINEPFDEKVIAGTHYSEITSNKMILYPFISYQKEIDFSDETNAHKNKNLANRLFAESESRFKVIQEAFINYKFFGS